MEQKLKVMENNSSINIWTRGISDGKTNINREKERTERTERRKERRKELKKEWVRFPQTKKKYSWIGRLWSVTRIDKLKW